MEGEIIMNANFKIGTWEAVATLGCISLIPILLTLPTYDAESFGTATFAQTLYSSFITLLVIFVLLKLFKNFENMDVLDVVKYGTGNFLYVLCGLILISYLFILCVLTFSEFTQNLQNVIFPDAPQEYVALFFGVAIIISLYLGIRGIFRTASLIAPLIAMGFLLMFIILFKYVDFTNFTPIFGNDVKRFWLEGLTRIGRFEGVFYFLLISPYVKSQKKVAYLSFLQTILLILPTMFLLIGTLPYPTIIENYFPIFELTRLISLGRFIQRVDSAFILLWILATFVYLSLTMHFLILYIQKIFRLKYSSRLIPLLTMGIIAVSTIFVNYEITIKIRNFIFVYITPYILCILPTIFLIIARIKRRIQCKKIIKQQSF